MLAAGDKACEVGHIHHQEGADLVGGARSSAPAASRRMARDGYEADKIRLFIADLSTGEKKDYSSAFDNNAEQLVWSNDGTRVYFISCVEATAQLFALNLASGEITGLTHGIHDYGHPVPAGEQLLVTKNSMSQPAELYLVDPVTGTDQPLTTVNKGILDQLTFGKVEKRMVTTTDNKQMLTWVIYPPGFDASKKYPALLYCQGASCWSSPPPLL